MNARLDEWLGRITMYRLVLYGLIALILMAFLLMLVGNIEYAPLHFALSIFVLGSVAYGSNLLFAWLFGIKPHSESAWITALILALLFIPPTEIAGFIKLGLVVAIAMASKYVIAPRGRHMFNPAAIGIVIASVSGLAYAGWWVATPAMIPLTLITGALILRRAKKQFVALAMVVTAVVSLLLQGTDPVTALTSWPLLFVGAFMLTEPLTLPPRARQQYIVAIVTGLLMTLPFSYGRVTMTPALALVVGNLIGWWFGQRHLIKLRYIGKKQMNDSSYDFTFDTDTLKFEPGQYLELSLVHEKSDTRGHRRIFSIAARPGDEQINIGTKIPAKPSSFKRALMNLRKGDIVYATRVGGDFVLPEDKTPVVFIAGGIGITPFISYIQSSSQPLRLIYSVSRIEDLSYVDQLKQHNIDVTVISTDVSPLPDKEWHFINGSLDADTLSGLLNSHEQSAVYISGPPAMVAHARRIVKTLGVRRIRVDEFSGY